MAKKKSGATFVPLMITYYSDELKWGGHSCFFHKIHSLPKIPVDQILAPIIQSYEIWCKLFSPPHEVEESSSWYWPRSTISLGFPHSSTLGVFKQWMLSANMCTVPRAILTASIWILCLRLQEAFALINEPGALRYSGWSALLLMLFW